MIVLLVLVPLVAAAIAMLVPSNRHRPWILPVTAVCHLALVVWMLPQGEQWAMDRWLAIDPLSRLFVGFISVLFFICALYAPAYLRLRLGRDNRILVACLLVAFGMMSLVTLSHHLGLMWIAMEATTLATAPCVYFNRNPKSLEATWKYLVIGSVGIALALLGSFFLIYAMVQAGSESTLLFDELIEHSHPLSLPWLHAAFVLLLVGYGTKMGLSPMHTWKPDAYGEAPGIVGALLAGGLTSCAFLCVLRFFHIAHIADDDQHSQRLLIFMGLLSMGTAAVFMPRQRDIKRLLAYSSVEHMGMLVFGLGIGGIATGGALLHVIHNGLCKAGLFLAAANIHRAYCSKTTDQVRGVLKRLPWSGWMMMILFFAITGSPLFGPFVSEFQILSGTFDSGNVGRGITFLVLLLIVFFGMGSVLLGFMLGPAEEVEGVGSPQQFRESFLLILPIFIAVGLTVLLGVYTPSFLTAWVDQAVAFLQRIPLD
ncbi:Na(+)/H(+) antiporter subunit D [Novipirellula aureliae]|uniref:Na(+)/H(+) antiporter subunit D n=1 Tax=Novipirellula aureliae TaxID=2527966 RepID=A0A5C6DI03_9BACT|nr:proton-conducting transporter membrane subunit [Novipirellula aureliae]TWU34539.1 Na(+)/H(+) antiporter subunit D [Novipirellula aureliae]